MKIAIVGLLLSLLCAVSYGVDLKCDIDICGTSYLKTIMDHPDGRCRAADAFKSCVHEACKNSPINGLVNYVYLFMELFGITSCTKDSGKTMEEKESFDKCAMQKGQQYQQPLEESLGSLSFGIEPEELCRTFNKVISCLRGICVGNSDSFVQNMTQKHNLKCALPSAVSRGVSLRFANSRGVDLKCLDLCGTSYLKTIMDHPDGRCRAADAFKSCVHEACKDSPINGLVNYGYMFMELFGITSCTKDMYYY